MTSEVTGSDDERFSALFFAHAARLVRLAALLGAADPEDVVQEAFCRVFGSRGRLSGDDARAAAYLRRAVVNETRDRHRRLQVAVRARHLVAAPESDEPGDGPGERDAVLRAVADLPERQREAVVLRYWLDLPLAEVAASMGTRVGTAKAHVSRGVARVREALTESDESFERNPR